MGDFRTPEQFIPETPPESDWDSCITMNDHWGYHAEDRHWKTAREMVCILIETASKGGNLLLNVGPQPDGRLPGESRERLRKIGRWMRSFGESIYGTSATPFAALPAWGRCTAKPGRLYAHVLYWPAERTLRLPKISNTIRRAYPLGRPGSALSFRRVAEGVEVDLPARAPDPWDSVIVLEMDGMPKAVSSQ